MEPNSVPLRYRAMIRTLCCRTAATGCLVFIACTGAQAGVKEDFNRAMQRFDRDLCRTFEFKACKPATAKRKKTPRKTPAAAKQKATPVAPTPQAMVPVPRQKPTPPDSAENPVTRTVVPVPRAKPIMPVKDLAASNAVTPPPGPGLSKQADPKTAAIKPGEPPPVVTAAPPVSADPDCHDRLARIGLVFAPQPMQASTGQCTLTDPVQLSALGHGRDRISFPDRPVLNCAFAESFAKWITEKAQAATQREAKSRLSVIYTGPGYQCRARNGDGTAKLSEHAFGNAVDITQLKLEDGRTIQVADALNPVSPAYAVLKSMRFTACERFSTVLGPGSNAAHADHFHFDNGRHGKTGTYRICE